MPHIDKSHSLHLNDKSRIEIVEEDPELDEEGLRKQGYDVIIVSTGLTQSILASALTRAGKSVLQCDENDFYGDLDAVMSLNQCIDWANSIKNRQQNDGGATNPGTMQTESHRIDLKSSYDSLTIDSITDKAVENMNLAVGMKVITPYGQGTVVDFPTMDNHNALSMKVKLDGWILANGKSPIAHFGIDKYNDVKCLSSYFKKDSQVIPLSSVYYEKYIQSQAKRFALDLSPALLYANGDAVSGMIDSGVSEYCEFKSLLGLYLFMKEQNHRRSDKGANSALFSVPCSKREVFETKLLSPLDKRRLMTFLQIASDYATATSITTATLSGEDTTENEKQCNSNDPSRSTLLQEEVVTSLNERQLQQGRSLYRPQNKSVATNDLEKLQTCIQENKNFHAYLKEQKLSESLIGIIIHAMAMRDSNCSIKDGMNGLCRHLQSLGRFGGTAFLVPLYGSGELPQAFCRSAAVHGGTYLLRRGAESIQMNDSEKLIGVNIRGYNYDDGKSLPSRLIPTKNVILPSHFLPDTMVTTKCRVHRRISLVRGRIIHDKLDDSFSEQRHVIMVPPGDDSIRNTNVIRGIILDESSQVAPYVGTEDHISVVHLTTTSNNDDFSINEGTEVLARAIENLLASGNDEDSEELFSIGFSYDAKELSNENVTKDNIYVCECSEGDLTIESSFIEAKKIFHQLFPHDNFLKLSHMMDEIITERRMVNDEEDDEMKLLQSALNMMGTDVSP